MASLEAMNAGGGKRYLNENDGVQVPQGVAGTVVDKGSLQDYVPYLHKDQPGLPGYGRPLHLKELHEALYPDASGSDAHARCPGRKAASTRSSPTASHAGAFANSNARLNGLHTPLPPVQSRVFQSRRAAQGGSPGLFYIVR